MTKIDMLRLLMAEGDRLCAAIDAAQKHWDDTADPAAKTEWDALLERLRHNSHIARLVVEAAA